MEITVIFLLILIKFYWCSTENIKAEYMHQRVCLLKNPAKFKAAIFLMVLKDEANGFSKMLSLCAVPSERNWIASGCIAQKSKESHQWRKGIELQSTWKEKSNKWEWEFGFREVT